MFTVGQKVEVGTGTKWQAIVPVVKVGKTFNNGKTQVWVKFADTRVACFHMVAPRAVPKNLPAPLQRLMDKHG